MPKCRSWFSTGMLAAALICAADIGAAEGPDACKLMQKADVEAAFAPRKFDGGTLSQPVKGSAKLPTVSDCIYTSQGASIREILSVSVSVRRAPTDATGMTPAQARLGAAAFKATVTDVSGLGDGAYWVNLGTAKSPSLQLNVFRGKREWRLFAAAGRMDVDTGLANLTKIAKATMER